MKRDDLMWLAGLLEGEGSFSWDARKFTPRIQITMADKDVMERVASLFGGKNLYERLPTPPRQRKSVYQCAIHGNAALEIMGAIYPIMGTRRKERITQCVSAARRRRIRQYKLKPEYIPLIRYLVKKGLTKQRVAEICDVSRGNISSIARGLIWTRVLG